MCGWCSIPGGIMRGESRRRCMPAEHPDAETLLRRFEPVIRSTKGDKFYPMDVEPYVRACSLWVQRPGEEAVCVVPEGKLDLEGIAQQPLDESGAVHFLKFTDLQDIKRPGSRGARFNVFRRRAARGFKESREAFHAGRGRLARVGYVSRFVDALYSITLLARGQVPGESAAGWFVRMAGWSCSTGCSIRSTTGGAASWAPTTTRRIGRPSSSTCPSLKAAR